ncbi:MAG: aldehyde dehydrogenase family protein [Solirubrobacterales bacterium]|jgi:acyl-CoA reductase-like NAD-dependent aldehyde dehydrogenase|nr:aldehyde dehydrogenase family protein [Solirubrobacterales bacterium]
MTAVGTAPMTVSAAVALAQRYAADPLPEADRCRALRRFAQLLRDRADEIAPLLVQEVGKPITLARGEVHRSGEVAERTASEWETLAGEVVATGTSAGAEGRTVLVKRYPLGVVCAITPFNFPVGLAVHKLAPVLVAGNACVVKPSERAPRTTEALRDLLIQSGFPPEAVPVVHGGPETVDALLADPGIALYSFTGSAAVGEKVKAASGLRPVLLELGSNAATIVHADADVLRAAEGLARGAYAYAGQACFGVQRIIVHRDRREELVERLVAAIGELTVGDPADPSTLVGPLIDEAAARRVEGLITAAVAGGATLLCGGGRDGSFVQPALLARVDREAALWRDEAFGPVAVLAEYDTIDEAIALANDSRYGLQTGLFTADIGTALYAADRLHTGTVNVNDTSAWRCAPMPFGGVGDSGIGREGPRYAIEAATAQRTVVLSA